MTEVLHYPIMEKACQAYHKQTAPAKVVNFLDSLTVSFGSGEKKGKKLIL